MAAVALVRTLTWRLLVRVLGVELLEGSAVDLHGHVVEPDEFAGLPIAARREALRIVVKGRPYTCSGIST